jgi:hypothetical protein
MEIIKCFWLPPNPGPHWYILCLFTRTNSHFLCIWDDLGSQLAKKNLMDFLLEIMKICRLGFVDKT